MEGCLDEATVLELVEGELATIDAGAVEAHLASCPRCRRWVSEVTRAAHEPGPDEPRVAPALVAGDRVGRYVVRRRVGAGAMGVVYAAHDPELDREVALKLVNVERVAREQVDDRMVRLQREAQAMARLSDPHVVAVYDVGEHAGAMFIAMELIDGTTLREWLRAQPRSWREVVAVLSDAGSGLAAAHDAGLAHRDFKLDNVLVGRDGRVCITDFGLARSPRSGELATTSDAIAAELTEPSAFVGTPAYMAPELIAGESADASSDQFSYGVALYESLYGERPFKGRDLAELVAAIRRGEIRAAPKSHHVPARLRRIALRAVRAARDERYPSMSAMLGELQAFKRSRRAKIAVVSAIAAVSAAIAVRITLAAAPSGVVALDECLRGAGLVDQVWTPAVRTRVGAGGGATVTVVDDWAGAWRLARASACAAEVGVRDARIACLDGELAELRAQTQLWQRGDRRTLDHAYAAAAALEAPGSCTRRTGAITWWTAATLERIATIYALQRAGRSAEAKPQLAALLAEAAAAGDPATHAKALYVAGLVERELGALDAAGEHFADAVREGTQAGDEDRVANAMAWQAEVEIDRGHPLEALGEIDAATSIADRSHALVGDQHAAAQLLLARGDALTAAGRPAEAVTDLRRAVAILEPLADHEHAERLHLAAAYGALGAAATAGMHYDEARAWLTRCLAIEETDYRPDHPEIARTLHDLAQAEAELGDLTAARTHFDRARTALAAAFGENYPEVALTDFSIGMLEAQQGHAADARALYDRARAELVASLGPDHPNLAPIEHAIGELDQSAGHCREAIPHFERAVEVTTRAGRGGASLADPLVSLAACLTDVGRDAEARPIVDRALAELAKAGVPAIERMTANAIVAELEWRAGHRDKAIALAKDVLTTIAGAPDYAPLYQKLSAKLARWTR